MLLMNTQPPYLPFYQLLVSLRLIKCKTGNLIYTVLYKYAFERVIYMISNYPVMHNWYRSFIISFYVDWFIKRWIAGANFAENGEDEDIPNYPKKLFVAKWLDGQERFGVGIEEEYLEYPKKCVLHVESSVSHLYEARRLIPVFDNNRASFRLTKRFSLCKTYSSREEEFYFRKSLFSCEMFFSRFKEGVIEFCCKFCQKWHTALLVYQIMFEEESAK